MNGMNAHPPKKNGGGANTPLSQRAYVSTQLKTKVKIGKYVCEHFKVEQRLKKRYEKLVAAQMVSARALS
jgi:hypothetical protein